MNVANSMVTPTGSRASSTRSEQLVEQMRADIASTTFAPGDRITESDLAARYGTSRTPVREALRILTQEMLLEHVPNWGHRVSILDPIDLDDLYSVRIAIECQAVSRLAAGHDDLDVVRELLIKWDVHPTQQCADVRLVFEDEQFHETLAAASGGTVLLSMLQVINRRIHSARIQEFVDSNRVVRTYAQHADILRAILSADRDVAVARMTAHVLEGKQYVRSVLRFAHDGGPQSTSTPSNRRRA